MKRWMKIAAGVVALGGVVFGAALWMIRVPAIAAETDGTALKAWFDERHAEPVRQFNGSALVVAGGNVLVRDAWGQDGEGRALTPQSRYRLASVSKSFTAAAILRLVDSGKLDLDQPVSTQVDDCAVEATPAQLLRHVSGLPDRYMNEAPEGETFTIPKAYSMICATGPEASDVGEFRYNNAAYVLLAALVEKVDGRTFEAFMRAEVLTPLGMDDTRVWNLVSEDDFTDRAISFDDDGALSPTYLDGIAGDGGVFSTVDDLRNWARFWQDDRLISTALKDRATGRGQGDGYYFGLTRRGERISHNGSWLGARTHFGFVDGGDAESVVVLLDNGSSIFIDDIAQQVWERVDAQ